MRSGLRYRPYPGLETKPGFSAALSARTSALTRGRLLLPSSLGLLAAVLLLSACSSVRPGKPYGRCTELPHPDLQYRVLEAEGDPDQRPQVLVGRLNYAGQQGLVVFVHGFSGDRHTSWGALSAMWRAAVAPTRHWPGRKTSS